MKTGVLLVLLSFFCSGLIAHANVIASVPEPAPVSVSPALLPAVAMTDWQEMPKALDLNEVHSSAAAMTVTSVAATPEPASVLSFSTGLVLLALMMWRSRRREAVESEGNAGQSFLWADKPLECGRCPLT